MTTVKGIIDEVHESKPSQKYPDCCNFSLKVNGTYYQVFTSLKRKDSFKVGDQVEITGISQQEYNGMPQYKFKMDGFTNLSNPSANAKKGGSGGGWKPRDPEEQIRIANQSQITNAVHILTHNSAGKIIKKEQVLRLAAELVDFVYSNKPSSMPKAEDNPPLQAENPPANTYHINDDPIPF